MGEYTLNEVAEKQAELLNKVKELPVNDTSQAILRLLDIQVHMAHIMADFIKSNTK